MWNGWRSSSGKAWSPPCGSRCSVTVSTITGLLLRLERSTIQDTAGTSSQWVTGRAGDEQQRLRVQGQEGYPVACASPAAPGAEASRRLRGPTGSWQSSVGRRPLGRLAGAAELDPSPA